MAELRRPQSRIPFLPNLPEKRVENVWFRPTYFYKFSLFIEYPIQWYYNNTSNCFFSYILSVPSTIYAASYFRIHLSTNYKASIKSIMCALSISPSFRMQYYVLFLVGWGGGGCVEKVALYKKIVPRELFKRLLNNKFKLIQSYDHWVIKPINNNLV